MQSTTNSRQVAVIDDDDGFAASLLALLESGGFRAERFPSAEAFIENNGDHYDALLVDWVLPGMSGESLCRQLSEKADDAKLTLMSGECSCDSLSKPLPERVTFLGKPFDPDCLLDTLSDLFGDESVKK